MKISLRKIFYAVIIGISFGFLYFLLLLSFKGDLDLLSWLNFLPVGNFGTFFLVLFPLIILFVQFGIVIWLFPKKKFLASLISILACYVFSWWLFMGWLSFKDSSPLSSIKDIIYELVYIPFAFVLVNTCAGFLDYPLFALTFFIISFPFVYYFLKGEEKTKRIWKSLILALVVVIFLMTITGYITWPS